MKLEISSIITEQTMWQSHIAAESRYDGQTEWYDQDDYGLRHEVMKWKAVE